MLSSWGCFKTRAGREAFACDLLVALDKGIICYWPKVLKKSPRTKKVNVRPLFAQYVFFKFQSAENRQSLWTVPGIQKILSMPGKVDAISDTFIQDLKDREDPSTGLIAINARGFKKGDRILITDGPLTGIEAIICEPIDQKRVSILLNMFGNQTKTIAARESLEHAL
jgi:transcription antitermination factor NusG